MIRSMTGYGRATGSADGFTVTVELKSVNHRYFEFTAKVYRQYSFLEDKLKNFFKDYISRGKVECSVQIESDREDDCAVQINHSLAAGYMAALDELCETYHLSMDRTVDMLACHDDIFAVRKNPADEDAVWAVVKSVALEAVKSFTEMREIEGKKLKEDVLSKADAIIKNVEFIESRSPETVKEYNEKLKARIAELIGDTQVDEQRLLTEAAVFADKVAVDEETVRLRSHIDQLHTLFEATEPVGRKLDFLVQEINREANTVGSKASDIEIARRVIDIKAQVEKIREQIQNIE